MHRSRVIRGRYAVVSLIACITLAASDSAWALLQSCSVSATSVNFGTYNPVSASANNTTGTVSVTCQVLLIGLLASWTVSLSPGSSGNFTTRQLHSGANALSYNLYTNAARTSIWGDGTGGTSVISDSATLIVGSNTKNYTAYGSIPARQDRAPGSYTDTIIVTVTY